MFGRLADALKTLLTPGWDAKLSSDRQQVRELIAEMEDILEKFSRVVAREAKRRQREIRTQLDEPAPDAQPSEPQPITLHDAPGALSERKRAIWQRVRVRQRAAGTE